MTPLAAQIREEIRHCGPISFRRFMELALYHPELGYYCRPRDPFGVEGDYFTNSQLQPLFGRIVAQQIARLRTRMGSPPEFTVVEMGAGRGETLEEVQRSLPDVRCLAVERSSGELPERFSGVVYSNEYFDALPVHVVEKRGAKIIEYFVDVGGTGFQWVEGLLSQPALADYLDRYAPGLGEGQKIEVNLAALEELERIARSLQRGFVLTIDYGYTADEIAAARRFPNGSLMGYEKHQAYEDVFAEPGRRDITAHVNFTALEQRGNELGLASMGLRSQAEFLLDVGRDDEFEKVLSASGDKDSLALRLQLKTLLFGLGETFRVLLQRR